MSATIACPPPNERRESGTKTRMRPISRLSSIAALHHIEIEDAERDCDADYPDHREAQDADGDEGGEPEHDAGQVAPDFAAALEAHGERCRDADRRRAEQDEVRRGIVLQLAVSVTSGEDNAEGR